MSKKTNQNPVLDILMVKLGITLLEAIDVLAALDAKGYVVQNTALARVRTQGSIRFPMPDKARPARNKPSERK